MAQHPSNSQNVIKGISSQALVTIVLGLVEILSFSIMSRLLTQEDFGYYAVITAITTVFASFSDMGIGSAIVQQKELTKRYVDNAFTISLLFGFSLSLLLLVCSGPLSLMLADASMRIPLMLMSGTLLLHCLTSVNNSLMHRKLQFLRMGGINLFSLIITTCVAVWLAYKGFGYYAIITKAVLGSIITYLLSFYFCKTHFSFALDKATFRRIFAFSGWLMASSIFRNLAHQIDRLLMPRLLSVSALGAYNRPKDFVEQISTKLNGIFDTALFPVLSGIQDNLSKLKSAFCRSMFLMNAFALLLTSAFVFNSGIIIRIFFGEQWMELKDVMMTISCSLLFNIDGRLADCYLRSLAMTKQQFFFRIFEFVLKIIGILMAFKCGLVGVALSIVITNSITKIIKILYVGNKIGVGLKSTFEIIFSSWRYGLVLIPVCSIAMAHLPKTWGGDIALSCLFLVVTVIIFLGFPSLIGKTYHDDVYVKITSFVDSKTKKYR
ncbi:MAG: oligosaccharide flippase family protein [Bacteroidales bacterium]|nr:oligosaccharide flippase family protein [Bacteroidales bacterium]